MDAFSGALRGSQGQPRTCGTAVCGRGPAAWVLSFPQGLSRAAATAHSCVVCRGADAVWGEGRHHPCTPSVTPLPELSWRGRGPCLASVTAQLRSCLTAQLSLSWHPLRGLLQWVLIHLTPPAWMAERLEQVAPCPHAPLSAAVSCCGRGAGQGCLEEGATCRARAGVAPRVLAIASSIIFTLKAEWVLLQTLVTGCCPCSPGEDAVTDSCLPFHVPSSLLAHYADIQVPQGATGHHRYHGVSGGSTGRHGVPEGALCQEVLRSATGC